VPSLAEPIAGVTTCNFVSTIAYHLQLLRIVFEPSLMKKAAILLTLLIVVSSVVLVCFLRQGEQGSCESEEPRLRRSNAGSKR
jgi:multisubunit Na+/H+ antiporter MnhF subunit